VLFLAGAVFQPPGESAAHEALGLGETFGAAGGELGGERQGFGDGVGGHGIDKAERLVRGALTWGLEDGTREEQHGFHAVLKADSAMAAMKDFLATGEDITR